MIIIQNYSKKRAFTQIDYLVQVLELAIKAILVDFGIVTAESRYLPIFIEDSNPVHSYKSTTNIYTRFRQEYNIQLLNHPSILPDLNPIEKCWRAIKQLLYCCKIQPTNKKEIANTIIEEEDTLDQK